MNDCTASIASLNVDPCNSLGACGAETHESGSIRRKIDFGSGSPSPELIGVDVLERMCADFFASMKGVDFSIKSGNRHPLAYGPPRGDLVHALTPLAAFLSQQYEREKNISQ